MDNLRFELGQLVATPGALQALAEARQTPFEFLQRHISGDWGEVPDEDRHKNEDAVTQGHRILSAYGTAKGLKIWVLTEVRHEA
jgi:hypothetical protein